MAVLRHSSRRPPAVQDFCETERTYFETRADTEWRPIAEIAKGKWQLTQQSVCEIDLLLTPPHHEAAIETDSALVGRFLSDECQIIYSNRHTNLFELDGALCLFLFRLRAGRQKVLAHAASLFTVLRTLCGSKLVTDYVVSATLLMRHPYSPALLYNDAPFPFRDFVLSANVPIFVPLMLPVNFIGRFKTMGDTLSIEKPPNLASDGDLDVSLLARHTYNSFKNVATADTWGSNVYEYTRIPFATTFKKTNVGSLLHVELLDTVGEAICILLRLDASEDHTLDSLEFVAPSCSDSIYCGTLARCTATEAFVASDENGRWYSVSLRPYTSNWEAVLGDNNGASDTFNPPLRTQKIEKLRLDLLFRSACVDYNSLSEKNITVYLRFYKTMVQTNDGTMVGLANRY